MELAVVALGFDENDFAEGHGALAVSLADVNRTRRSRRQIRGRGGGHAAVQQGGEIGSDGPEPVQLRGRPRGELPHMVEAAKADEFFLMDERGAEGRFDPLPAQLGLQAAALARQPIDIGDGHDFALQKIPVRPEHHIDGSALHLFKVGDDATAHPLVGRPKVGEGGVVAADPRAVGAVAESEHIQRTIEGVNGVLSGSGQRQRLPAVVFLCGSVKRPAARIAGQSRR